MAIDRGPWNALLDDDGSNLVGSIWNKAAIKTVLLDPIDGAPTVLRYGPAVVTPLLDQNNVVVAGGAAVPIWLLNAAAPQNVTGFVAEPDGTEHILVNMAAGAVTFYNQHANSTVGNRLITPGYAATYVLGTWQTIRMVYLSGVSAWLLQKAG